MKGTNSKADDKRFAWTLAIFATALAVRLVHVWQIRASPFFSVLMGDSHGYDDWAQRIAGGDWIGREVLSRAGDGRARAHARERARLDRGPPRLGRLRALAPAALRRPRRARGCVVSGRRRYRRPAGCDPKQRRRRRPVPHHVAIRTELLHREQPGGRWHLSVAALRERRTRIRAPGCHRTGGDRARPAADTGGGLELLDRQGAGLYHVTPRGLADVDGPEGRAAVERDRDARHREPGGARRMVVAVAHRRRDRALRRAGAARSVPRRRDVGGAGAAVGP